MNLICYCKSISFFSIKQFCSVCIIFTLLPIISTPKFFFADILVQHQVAEHASAHQMVDEQVIRCLSYSKKTCTVVQDKGITMYINVYVY